MGEIIKEIAVFVIIGEMLIFLLPDKSYDRYLRLLLNLLLLLVFLQNAAALLSMQTPHSAAWNISHMEAEIQRQTKYGLQAEGWLEDGSESE